MSGFDTIMLQTLKNSGQNTEEAEAYVQFMSALHRHRSEHMRQFKGWRLHPGQAALLLTLGENEGVTQREIADLLGIATPTVNIMLRKMKHSGLIETKADDRDRRRTRVYRSEKGCQLSSSVSAAVLSASRSFSEGLTKRECEQLRELLPKVCSKERKDHIDAGSF